LKQEDADVSTKVFNDIDKAKHSVCLQNVPRDVPRVEVEKQIRSLFLEILEQKNLPKDQLISV
jgi:hypothetical protein